MWLIKVKALYSPRKKVWKEKTGNKTFFRGGFSLERGGVLPAKMQQRTEVSVNLELIHFAHNSVCKKVLVSFFFLSVKPRVGWIEEEDHLLSRKVFVSFLHFSVHMLEFGISKTDASFWCWRIHFRLSVQIFGIRYIMFFLIKKANLRYSTYP